MTSPFRPDFKEDLHPRGPGGKFASKPHVPKVAKRRRPRPTATITPRPPGKGRPKPIRYDPVAATPKLREAAGLTPIGESRPPKPSVPFAFTDESYAARARMLEKRTRELKAGGVDSRSLYTVRNPDGTLSEQWKPERLAQHQEILHEFLNQAKDVPREGKAIFAGGLGGAGKGTVLRDSAGIPDGQYLTVNPDEIKEAMASRDMIPNIEGLSPMEANSLIHEEASDLAKDLARMAAAEKINIIWDITMSSDSSVQGRIDRLREAGYTQIDGLFVSIDVNTSRTRAEGRHRSAQQAYENGTGNGGRFLPPEETAANEPTPGSGKLSRNAEVFDRIAPQFSSTVVFNNMVERGAPPIVESTTGPNWDAQNPVSDGALVGRITEPADEYSTLAAEVDGTWLGNGFDSVKDGVRDGAMRALTSGYDGPPPGLVGYKLTSLLRNRKNVDGQNVLGGELVARAVHGEPTTGPLWRGAAYTPEFLASHQEGSSIALPLSSFSPDYGGVKRYAAPAKENWSSYDRPENAVPVILKLEAGAKVAALGKDRDQNPLNEHVAFGEFQIVKVEPDTSVRGTGATEITIRQTSLMPKSDWTYG